MPTWGPSRADVGVARLPIGVGRRPCGGLHRSSILTSPRPYFAFLLPREMAFPPRFRGSEARSDHDFAVSLAMPCVRNMLRERSDSMRHPWVISECPPVRERRRRCWYAAPFRRFARLVDLQLMVFFYPRRAENRTFRPPVTQKQKNGLNLKKG